MTINAKAEKLFEDIAAFSSLGNLHEQCIRAYEIDKQITGHLKLEELAEKIAAKRPVMTTSETNTVKRRLLDARKALAPYQKLHESMLTMQRIESLNVTHPVKQLEALNQLKAELPKHKSNSDFNKGLDDLKHRIDSRINFLSAIQEHHERFNNNLRKIQTTSDPVKRLERLERYKDHFLKSCVANINIDGFESEFTTQFKLWAYQFQQMREYNVNPPFDSNIPNAKKLHRAWRDYLLISPLALVEKANQLEKIQGLLEQCAQASREKLQGLDPSSISSTAIEVSEEEGVVASSSSASSNDDEAQVAYSLAAQTVEDDNQFEASSDLNNALAILDRLQDQVENKLEDIRFTLDIDKHYHQDDLSTNQQHSALQRAVGVVQKMQKSDVDESLNIPGQLKHIAEDARLEAIDPLHRHFTVPGPLNGLVQNWTKAVEANPNTTPPFFTWLQIAPAYQNLEWVYGENKGKIFVESSRLSGLCVAGIHLDKGRVKYLNSEQRQQRLLTIDNGILKAHDNSSADTSFYRTQNFGGGTATFVMSPSGKFYIGEHIVGQEYHSTLLSGGSTRCAGMVKIDDGRIDWITNKTGHYRTGNAELVAELFRLQNQGLDLSQTKVRFIVVIENKMRHEDYAATELLSALRSANIHNLDLTSKEGIQFMEPLLADATQSLGLTRAETSTFRPAEAASSVSEASQPEPDSDNEAEELNYGLAADEDSDSEHKEGLGYDLEPDEQYDELGYEVDLNPEQEEHRVPSISFSFTKQDSPASSSHGHTEDFEEKPSEDKGSKSSFKNK